MSFSNWLAAPFLKELSGKQLYEVMLAIKEGGVTGECECYVENGNAFVLHFVEGQPTSDKAKIAEILKRKSIVCAWMPGKTGLSAKPDRLATERDAAVRADFATLMAELGAFAADNHWLILLHQADIVASSEQSDASGANLATALVAQINGTFREMTRDKTLQRFSLDFGGTRFGFETLGGSWSAVYRLHEAHQAEARSCTTRLRELLAPHAANEGVFAIKSAAVEQADAKYCLVRPQTYQKIETDFRAWAEKLEAPWDSFWFQYDGDIIFSVEKRGEGQQQIGGAFAELNHLVRGGFERLTGKPASNFVLYADEITLWCDFFEKGFWATRFADDKTGYRRSAEQAARHGWGLAEKAFTRK